MSKTYRIVDEFEFPESGGFSGSAGKTHVKGYCRGGPKRYAKGGSVEKKTGLKQDRQTAAVAVHKHERNMHPGKPLTKLARGGVPTYGRKPLVSS